MFDHGIFTTAPSLFADGKFASASAVVGVYLPGSLDRGVLWKAKGFWNSGEGSGTQSGAFTICAFVALDIACSSRIRWRLSLLAPALIFLAKIFYVTTSERRSGDSRVDFVVRLNPTEMAASFGCFLVCGLLGQSSGHRHPIWARSLRAIDEAPLFGHGTRSIREVFRRQGSETANNTHNQIFAIAIQLGFVGFAVLMVMWAAHWQLFFALHQSLAATRSR